MKKLLIKSGIFSLVAFMFSALFGADLLTDGMNHLADVCNSVPVIDTLKSFVAPASSSLAVVGAVFKFKDVDGKDREFTEKSAEEIDSMTTQEVGDYLQLKYYAAIAKSRIDTENQIKEIKESNTSESEKSKETIKRLEDTLKTLTKELDTHIVHIKKLTENGSNPEKKESDLLKFINREGKEQNRDKEIPGFESIRLKAAALMTTANVGPNVAGGFSQLFGNYFDTDITSAPKPDTFIMDLVTVKPAPGTENIYWTERINEEGDAEFIAEGALKPLADAEWKTYDSKVKEVAVRWKMSDRLIMHAPSVVADFKEHAEELVEQKMDDGVLSGDGTGNNLSGITTSASAFIVPSGLANYYQDSNIFDVIMAVATFVRLNNFKGKLTAVLGTVWMAKMMGIKDVDGRYIIPSFVAPDGTRVGDVEVRFENKMPDTHILLGDLKQFNVVVAEDVIYAEGYENDDFSKNLSSRKLEAFMGTYIKSSSNGAIVYDAIATIQTAITAV